MSFFALNNHMPMDTTHIKRTTINELIDVLDFDRRRLFSQL